MDLPLTVAPLKHGPISCAACFPPGRAPGDTHEADGWRVDNNPGYWGAAHPEVLVLGFSKGANQRGDMPFDRIAFNNARGNFKEILAALGFVDAGADNDACFTSAETRIGVASVVRCGLGMEIEPGKYATSGKVVRSAIAPGSPVRRFFDGCTERFLKRLPESVRVVVFLGLDRPYVEALFARMKELHPSITRLSELAYRTKSVTFVHVIHPSPLATSHRQKWLCDDMSSLADSRREVCRALGRPMAPPRTMGSPMSVPKAKAAPTPRAARPDPSEVGTNALIGELRAALADGRLRAVVVENQRTGAQELVKVFRLRRSDGNEFVIERTRAWFNVWSSVAPSIATALAEQADVYTPARTRHSNLSSMPKLRGPKNGHPGSRAWKLNFKTLIAARDFILHAR
ncbi:MAG: hypothetical protein KGM42_15665 [Hyphomicrobiales bacterium]|nr:hypothetical protein [Hyphomicrobiales bacterium]